MNDKDIIRTDENKDKELVEKVEDIEVVYEEPEDYFPKKNKRRVLPGHR